MKSDKIIVFSVLFLNCLNTIGQEIKTSTDKSDYIITDRIEVKYEIEREIDSVGEIDKSQFSYVGGPSISHLQSWQNGKTTNSTIYTYSIEAKKTGRISLPQLTMYVDGKAIKSEIVEVDVTGTILTDEQISDRIKSGNLQYKEYEVGHNFEIKLPAYFEVTHGINAGATIEFINRANEILGGVYCKTKEDIKLSGKNYTSLNAYHENSVKEFTKNNEKKVISQPKSIKLNDNYFVETDGTFLDTRANVNRYFFIGSFEVKTVVYTVVIYTLSENKNKFKANFQKILYSLKD